MKVLAQTSKDGMIYHAFTCTHLVKDGKNTVKSFAENRAKKEEFIPCPYCFCNGQVVEENTKISALVKEPPIEEGILEENTKTPALMEEPPIEEGITEEIISVIVEDKVIDLTGVSTVTTTKDKAEEPTNSIEDTAPKEDKQVTDVDSQADRMVYILKRAKRSYYHSFCCTCCLDKSRLKEIPLNQAMERGYVACDCFDLTRKFIKSNKNYIEEKKGHVTFMYDDVKGILYIRSKLGFWKILYSVGNNSYILYHLSSSYVPYNPDYTIEDLEKFKFHHQKDAGSGGIKSLVEYIIGHDKNKAIYDVDYRKMPKSSKKQREYYKQARNRNRRRGIKRTLYLIKELERAGL